MTDSAARMAAYAEHLETYGGVRIPHVQGTNTLGFCVPDDHCHIHYVDEPDNGDVYRTCGECCHVFVTEEDLQREDLKVMTEIWQSGLRNQLNDPADTRPLDHSDAPASRPGSEIYSCPLCAHDF